MKLIDVVSSGVGALGGPPLLILKAHCEGKAARIRQGYTHLCERLEARHVEEMRALPPAPPRQLPPSSELLADEIEVIFEEADRAEVKRAADTFALQTLRRRANAMVVVGEAADHIGDAVSNESVDGDWTAHFFDSVKDVSAADLQSFGGSYWDMYTGATSASVMKKCIFFRMPGFSTPLSHSSFGRTIGTFRTRRQRAWRTILSVEAGRECRFLAGMCLKFARLDSILKSLFSS